MLKQVKKEYVQKSRLFLYPLLGIERGVSTTPIQTYMIWHKTYDVRDFKLIAVYHKRTDTEFKIFEGEFLTGNKLFEKSFDLEDGSVAYVFDFNEMKTEYSLIVKGKYSQLTESYKEKILKFYGNSTLIKSYLYPEKYFKDAARLLTNNVADRAPMEKLLKKVGELCSIPDLSQEKLKICKKILNFESVNEL